MNSGMPGLPFPAHSGTAEANMLARRLISAENAFHSVTSGQVDGILDQGGNTYLLRATQEHLRRDAARLRALFDGVPDVITVLSESGEIKYQSPAVTIVLGFDDGALVGLRIFDFVHSDDLPGLQHALAETIGVERPGAVVEFRHRTRAGSWCPLEATLGSFRQADVASVILTFRDITHRQVAREASDLREAASTQGSLDKDRFLAMLSHELRTPLTPVLLSIHALQQDVRLAEAQPALAMIRRNIDLQSRLLDELTDYITVGQHKVQLHLEPIDAHDAVGFVLEICRGELASAQIKVVTELQATEKMVLADSVKLQQVMWNLLRNAIKFSPPGGSVFITSRNESPGGLTIEFLDQGIGIEPELLPFIFDAYQQGGHTQQKRYGGLGLGLFIAKGLVESQGGALTAASEGRGRGAKFCLGLELAPVVPDPCAPAVDPSPQIRKVVQIFPQIQPAEVNE